MQKNVCLLCGEFSDLQTASKLLNSTMFTTYRMLKTERQDPKELILIFRSVIWLLSMLAPGALLLHYKHCFL